MIPESQQNLIRHLANAGLPFVVIGGHAVSFHGHIRATEDVDIVWLRSPESEPILESALRHINASWISDEIDPSTNIERLVPVSISYIRTHHLMMLVTDLGFLDIFDYLPDQ